MDYNSIQAVVVQEIGLPSAHMAQQLLVGVQCANSGVNRALFGGAMHPILPNLEGLSPMMGRANDATSTLSTFSVMYASFVIANNTTYGFNKTIQNVNFGTVTNWISSNGSTVGLTMFLDYIAAPNKLNSMFTDASSMAQSAQAIHDNLGSKDAFEMLITQLQHGSSSNAVLPAKVFLVLMKAADATGRLLSAMQANWQQSNLWNLVSDWDSINWFDTVQNYFNVSNIQFNTVNSSLTKCLTQVSGVANKTKSVCPPCTGLPVMCPACYNETVGHTTTYGQNIQDWINSPGGPASLGYRSGIGPNNQVFTPQGHKGGCLLMGTKVLTASGEWIPIEAVTAGTRLLNGKEEIVVASAEIVTNTEVDAVYGINSDEPMMSKEHAVMTQRGWCSLDPQLSMSLNPHIKVGRLGIGDVVWRMKTDDNGNRSIALETVWSINHRAYEKGREKTGIAINFGNDGESLWANGYCTLANFPEMNAVKVAYHAKNTLTRKENAQLINGLKGASLLFEKVLGSHAFESLLDAAENPHQHPDLGHANPAKDLSNITMPLMLVAYKEAGSLPNARALSIINGRLLVNNQHVDMHTDSDYLYWTRTDEDKHTEHGALRFATNRLSAYGVVSTNGVAYQASVYTKMDYTTTYGDDNKAWYTFETGFVQNEDGTKTHYWQLADSTGKVVDTKNVTCNFSLATAPNLGPLMQVDIEFNPTWVAWTKGEWIAAQLTFTNDFTAFSGAIYKYDNTKPQNRGQGFVLEGSYTQHAAMAANRAVLSAAFLEKPIHRELFDTASETNVAAPHLAAAMALSTTQHLSVEALFSLPIPDMNTLHETNFTSLRNLMVYSVPNNVLKWFNQNRPGVGPGQPLSQAEADLTQTPDVDNFLKNRFAMGYLSQAFGGAADPKIKNFYADVPNWEDKMAYFWQGAGTGCFASNKGYNLAAATVMQENYIRSVPGLQPYLDNNPKGWAQQLYNYCLKPSVLSNLSNIDPQNGGMTHVNNLVMMLGALDNDKVVNTGVNDDKTTYGSALYRAILDNRMRLLRSNFTTYSDSEEMADWLNAFLRQYFEMAQNGNPDWGSDTQQAAKENLDALLKRYDVSSIEALQQHWQDVVVSMVQILNEFSNLPLTKRLDEWAKSNPLKSKGFGVAMSFAVFGLATFALIKTAINWKKLSPSAQSRAIVDTASSIANVFSTIIDFKAAQVLTLANGSLDNKLEASSLLTNNLDNTSIVRSTDQIIQSQHPNYGTEDPLPTSLGKNTAQSISKVGNLEEGSAFWGKFSNVASKVSEGLGVLALGFACWASGEQIYNDVKSGQPTAVIVFDVLEEVANAVCFLVSGGAFVAGFFVQEVASFIPVIGAVFAVLGIIFALVSMFLHRKPPLSDAEKFVKDTIIPWLRGLADAPAGWLAERKKAQEHINTPALQLA